MGSQLTGKQARFVEEYLQDFNATRAAERAGYAGDDNSLAVRGYELVRNPKIQALVKIRLNESAMTANEVLARLAAIARSDYSRYLKEDATVDFANLLADSQGFLVKSIKETKYGKQVEFYDAQRALETLAKHFGLFIERHVIVDWRRETREAGFDPAAAFERLVQEAVETVAVATGNGQPDVGSVAGSQKTAEGTT